MINILILCGGLSTRMGTDKGTLMAQGKTWVQHAIHSAQIAKSPVFLSVNAAQAEKYSGLFPNNPLIIDDFAFAEGPLKGIMTAHKYYPDTDWLVMACDMPGVSSRTVLSILKAYHTDKRADFYLFETGDGLQPFPGIYTAGILKWIYNYSLIGKLQNNSLKGITEFGKVYRQSLIPGRESDLYNYNRVEDLKKLAN